MEQTKTKKFDPTKIIMIVLMAVLILYGLVLIMLLLWGFLSSFKTAVDFDMNILGFPKTWQFSNYTKVLKNFYVERTINSKSVYIMMPRLILNSVLYAVGGALIAAFIPCIVGYLIQRFPCKLSKVLNVIVIVTMVIPITGNQTAMLQILLSLKLYNTMYGMWALAFSFTSMYTLVYIACFKGLPMSFTEAAYLDGAGPFRVFFKIYLPLVKGTFFTIFLLLFIARWNDYYTPMLYMPDQPTLAYGLKVFDDNTQNGLDFPSIKLAGCMVLLIPILIIFGIFHKRIMSNISMGGVKE